MPVVRAVPTLVVTAMAAMAFDLPVDLEAPLMPAPVLADTVDVPVLVALKESSGRVVMASAAVPMVAAEFSVAVAAATPVALPVVPSAAAVSLSSRDAMVRNEKDGLIAIYMFN